MKKDDKSSVTFINDVLEKIAEDGRYEKAWNDTAGKFDATGPRRRSTATGSQSILDGEEVAISECPHRQVRRLRERLLAHLPDLLYSPRSAR